MYLLWRLGLLALALFFGVGCAAMNQNGQWDDVKKDWRGDNMEMRSGSSGMTGMMSPPS